MIYNEDNNIYVERAVLLRGSISDVVSDLFADLSYKYNNNVGGCWSFKKGGGFAYCGVGDMTILLRGYIRLDDIDWLKTCDLNYHHQEYEIRVKPNAKVELHEVVFNKKYKLPLKDTLVVSSTYFGNNRGFEGNLATIDDGMGHRQLVDRDGNLLPYEQVSKVKHLFGDYYAAYNLHGKCSVIDEKRKH